ncbi:MAG: proline racemase family protein [Acidobacteriota bacterium]
MRTLDVIDSHTEGEPTRVVVAGGPDLGGGDVAERLRRFRRDHDAIRSAVVHEPRGFDALVGALLLEPSSPDAAAGMIFFNNADTLHMCGHGTIGVAATLQHLGRISAGRHRLESPVGTVEIELHADGSVSVDNVFSYRYKRKVEVPLDDGRSVSGDIAWGGNWFFLVGPGEHRQHLDAAHLPQLLAYTSEVRRALDRHGVTGRDGGLIDHIELYGEPTVDGADGKNFVLCPGGEYDRCPCGTGTSAKMACLAADGALVDGGTWRQEGILGTCFDGRIQLAERDGVAGVSPRIRGRAWVTAESRLILAEDDPFADGIRKGA